MPTPSGFSGRFFTYLLDANHQKLHDFKQWLFHPGMLFQARQQWWGQERLRPALHEGLDLCWYEDADGVRRVIAHTTLIPAPFAGRVVKISRDFLGHSVFLEHDRDPITGRRLYTAFGHTSPQKNLSVGQHVPEGDIVAAISAPDKNKCTVPPHLHLTLAWIPGNTGHDQLTWDYLGTSPDIILLDPLAVFPTTYVII